MATIYMAAATLDGFIADENDGIDWLTGFEPNPNYDGRRRSRRWPRSTCCSKGRAR